jgi:hypothetical protein
MTYLRSLPAASSVNAEVPVVVVGAEAEQTTAVLEIAAAAGLVLFKGGDDKK